MELFRTPRTYNTWFGQSGNPFWLQHDETPNSPLSSKKMKFLIQLSFENVPYNKPNYIDYPPFIYFFIEPENRLLAIVLQID